MTVKINVSADVSDVQSGLKKVQDSADKINKSLSGEVDFDFKQGKDDLAELAANAKKLTDLLEKAKKNGSDLSGVDFDAVSKVFEEAAKSAEELDRALEYLGKSDGLSKVVKSSKDLTENIKKATREQKTLREENRKYITDQEKYDRARNSGAAGSRPFRNILHEDILGGGWRKVDVDEAAAKRKTRNFFDFAGIKVPKDLFGNGDSEKERVDAEKQAEKERISAEQKADRERQSAAQSNARRIAAVAGAVGSYAGSMGQGGGIMGSAGRLAGSGIGAAAGAVAGSLIPIPVVGSMIGAGVGAFAGKLLGGAGSAVDSKADDVTAEGAMYTDLRHSLGATSIDFEMLRGSVRHFSEGLGLAYNESAKLAKEFAHTANLNGEDGMKVGKEVGSAVAFGRGYGISPDQSVQFIATMRQMGVTQDDKGNRKLALQIAESVKSGGTSAKMDEVLASLQSYVQTSTRQSLTSADAGAYASFMALLTGSSVPGMKGDPRNAAATMNAADEAMRQGGAHGEASKNVSLAAYQQLFGNNFNAYDAKFVNEQGAFNDLGKSFDNVISVAEDRGDKGEADRYREMAKAGRGKTALSVNMDFLEKEFGHQPLGEFIGSGANHFGMGVNQFSALNTAINKVGGTNNLEKTLSDAGVDMSNMSMDKVSSLAALATGSKDELKAQAKRLQGLTGENKLSDPERSALKQGLDEDNEDKIRKSVLNLSSKHNALGDSGEKGRQLQATADNLLQEMATKLVPYTQAIKEGITELVRNAAPDSEFVKQMDAEKEKQKKDAEKASYLDAQIEERKKMVDDPSRSRDHEGDINLYNHLVKKRKEIGIPTEYSEIDAPTPWGNKKDYTQYGDSKTKDSSPLAKNQSDFIEKTKSAAERAATKINKDTGSSISASDIQAQWGLETGWGKSVLSGTNNLGNIKAGNDYKGRHKIFNVNEVDKDGKPYKTDQSFRAYDSLDDSADDYADLISRKYLNGKPAANGAEFAKRLKQGGYATDPDYESKLRSAANKINSNSSIAIASEENKSAKPETKEEKQKIVKEAVKGNDAIKKIPPQEKLADAIAMPESAKAGPNDPYDINQTFPSNEVDKALDPNRTFERNQIDDALDPNRNFERNQIDDALGKSADSDGKLPKGTVMGSSGQPIAQTITHKMEGKVTLYDPSGNQVADPVLMASVGMPVASGMPR